MEQYIFKLFIVKDNPKSQSLVERVQRLLKDVLGENYQVDIIDILENPELAMRDKVIASPTLIKVSPLPQKRLIGHFNDNEKIISGLNLLKHGNA
jgi:circadian clock protein KaiB